MNVVLEIRVHPASPELPQADFFNISKYAGRVKGFAVIKVMISSVLFTAARMHCVPSTGYRVRSVICIQPISSARFLHPSGGVAHQTSLRSPSIRMSYANSPPLGRRVAYSLHPVTARQDHC